MTKKAVARIFHSQYRIIEVLFQILKEVQIKEKILCVTMEIYHNSLTSVLAHFRHIFYQVLLLLYLISNLLKLLILIIGILVLLAFHECFMKLLLLLYQFLRKLIHVV